MVVGTVPNKDGFLISRFSYNVWISLADSAVPCQRRTNAIVPSILFSVPFVPEPPIM